MTGTVIGMSTADAIEWLAEQRRKPNRQSFQTVALGEHLLTSGYLSRVASSSSSSSSGVDDTWAFLEQLAIASLDIGRTELAELCISRLSERFPGSTRVAALQGMLLEAQGETSKALTLYDALLKEEEASMIISKRRIAALQSLPSSDHRGGPAKAIEALLAHLDAFANDLEGWQQLAALYLESGLYDKAVFALEESILLFPTNSFLVLQLGEVLYTSGEVAKAYKNYLRVLEMCHGDGAQGIVPGKLAARANAPMLTPGAGAADGQDDAQGPFLRALWGLKMCTTQLLASASLRTSGECQAEEVEAVDALATDLLLNRAYANDGAEGIKVTRAAARAVLGASSSRR